MQASAKSELYLSSADIGQDDLRLRPPTIDDGQGMWRVAQATGTLDLNAPYAYLMVGEYFSETSIVALQDDEIVGFVSGFEAPDKPATLFVWQVGVDPSQHGRGIGGKMLLELLERWAQSRIRYLETTQFLETTVTPSNERSLALFHGLARRLNTECTVCDRFESDLFPDGNHEEELVLRIGPIATETIHGEVTS